MELPNISHQKDSRRSLMPPPWQARAQGSRAVWAFHSFPFCFYIYYTSD